MAAAPSGAADTGAELLANAPGGGRGQFATAVFADPAETGVFAPVDTPLPTAPDPSRPMRPLTDQDQPLTITHTGDPGRGRRIAIGVSAAVVVVLAVTSALAVTAAHRPRQSGTPAPDATTATAAPPTAPTGPAATLRALPAAGGRGDTMRAVAAGPGGLLVAVGESSTDRVPRAWRYAAGRWAAVPGPSAGTTDQGGMTGIAAGPAGFVAVGWFAPRSTAAPTRAERHAATWTSTDGTGWILQATPDLGELSDVAARPGGGFVATGVDWKTDPDSGDGVVLTSANGRTWTRLHTAGLDGPGPTSLRRLLLTGSGAIAIGTRLDGSVTRAGIWSSPDLASWNETAPLPGPGAATAGASALSRTATGALLVVGGTAALDGTPTPLVWTGSPGAVRLRVLRAPAGIVNAVIATGGRLVAVGTRRSPAGDLPSGWALAVP